MVEEILNTINGIDDEEIQRVVEGMNEEVNCQYNNCNTNMHNAIGQRWGERSRVYTVLYRKVSWGTCITSDYDGKDDYC